MNIQSELISNLKKTYQSSVKKQRDDATQFIRSLIFTDPQTIKFLCHMLTPAIQQIQPHNYMMIQLAITNFISKYINFLISNTELLNKYREGLLALFYEVLGTNLVQHRHKTTICLVMGKLVIGTWGKEGGLAIQMFDRTIEVLKNGEYRLGVYLFGSLMASCPKFQFPIHVKERLLDVYLAQLANEIKLAQQEANEQILQNQRLQGIEHGVDTLIQFLGKIDTDKYRPLSKQLLKHDQIRSVFFTIFSLSPPGITTLILPQSVEYFQTYNRLRLLSFSILLYFFRLIQTGLFKIAQFPTLITFNQQVFLVIVQKLPLQISFISQKNQNIVNKMVEFMTAFITMSVNYQFVESLAEDIIYTIAFPLFRISDKDHMNIENQPEQYLNFLQSIINEKKKKRGTITNNVIKLIDFICKSIDGVLKLIVDLLLNLLEYCMEAREELIQKMSPKFINSQFFKTMNPVLTFESSLITLSSVAYVVSNRSDLVKQIQAFLIRNELKLLQIKDKAAIIALCQFFSYYIADIFKRKSQKPRQWTYFSYFLLIFQLKGKQNKALRLQSSQTIQNFLQSNNFKSLFLQDILNITDMIVNADSPQVCQIILLFFVIISEFTQTLTTQSTKIFEWVGAIENKVKVYQTTAPDTQAWIKYARLIEHIISQDDFYMFRDQIMNFFSPCLQFLKSNDEKRDEVIVVVSKYIMASRGIPDWLPEFVGQLIFIAGEQGRFSQCVFQCLNMILIYGDDNDQKELLRIIEMVLNKLEQDQTNQDLMQAVLLSHLIMFYHSKFINENLKSSFVHKTIRLMLNPQVNKNRQLFSKLILLILIMMKEEFQFISLLIESHDDFLHTFYSIAYNNSDTYVQQYDYKVFIIIQSTILDKNCHNPKQLQYIKQIFTTLLQLLQKLFRKVNSVYKIPQIENKQFDYLKDSDEEQQLEEERMQSQYEQKRLIDTYISPLKQIDEWNNFRSMINRMKADQGKWEFMSKIIEELPPKQKNFYMTQALKIQKMNIGGETTVRQIIKVKRPQ